MIGLLIIATGKYKQFVKPLLDSAEFYFMHGFEPIKAHIFTDDPWAIKHKTKRISISTYQIPDEKFPLVTLHRYRYFLSRRERINEQYLFYIDADMLFRQQVGVQCIREGKLTVVRHPGFYNGGWGSESVNKRSTAYIEDYQGQPYYAGGFNGGDAKEFWKMAEACERGIVEDETNGVMAQWHDESHMNKYLLGRDVHALDSGYCYPESWTLPFKKRILALDKDHKEIRR